MKFTKEMTFNVVFWTLYFLYEWLGLASLYGDYNGYFINACLAFPVACIFSFLVVHIFFRGLYQKDKKVMFWVCIIVGSCLLLLVRRYFNYYFIYPRYFPIALQMPLFSPAKFLVDFVNLYAITGLYALYYFIRNWYQERHRVQELLQQNTLAELDSLKAQVQPHFIFNTLNNIYGTALKSSPETAALIEHLAGLLDYGLYDASRDRVQLTAEIAYINHFIELQKNRYGSKLNATININDSIDGIEIAPLLLLPLVENCIKHGVGNSGKESWIRIAASREPGKFVIQVENSRDETQATTVNSGGIGLANVKKRLQLIYPGQHELIITAGINSYLVVLKIKTNKDDQVPGS